MPNQYPLVLRVRAPDPSPDNWWTEYRHLYETVASVGERHTFSPDRAWFAVWTGHGFDRATTHIAWRDPPLDDETRDAREQQRSQLREEDERRNTAVRAALLQMPRFDLPNRTYYLLEGPVSAATQLHDPEPLGAWRNPDLFWPDDRRWFVATDVDFWSLYIGGDDDFIAELARSVPTRVEIVMLDRHLEIEDWTFLPASPPATASGTVPNNSVTNLTADNPAAQERALRSSRRSTGAELPG